MNNVKYCFWPTCLACGKTGGCTTKNLICEISYLYPCNDFYLFKVIVCFEHTFQIDWL